MEKLLNRMAVVDNKISSVKNLFINESFIGAEMIQISERLFKIYE
jgi:hypothetical protein